MVGTADSVLIREVSFIQSILNREVPLLVHTYVCAVQLKKLYESNDQQPIIGVLGTYVRTCACKIALC